MGIFSTNNNAGRGRSGDHRAANFATEFLRVSDDVRREMIESLRRNTNRLLLIPRARSISEELRGRKAPFQAVFDFETGLARALHPGRKWHPGAQYFYASYFKERAAPFQTQTHNLSAAGRLSGPDLIPLLARMDFSEGRSFVLLFIEEILRGLVPALATALKQIELDHHRLKDALRPLHAADRSIAFGENAQRVRDDFLAFQKAAPELIALYMKRAEADPLLEPYVAGLQQLTRAEQPAGDDDGDNQINAGASGSQNDNESDGDGDNLTPQSTAAVPIDTPSENLFGNQDDSTYNVGYVEESHSDATAAPVIDAGDDVDDAEQPFETEHFAQSESSFDVAADSVEATHTPSPHSDAADAIEPDFAAVSDAHDSLRADADQEQPGEFEEFLAARRAEMLEIERGLNQNLAELQQEIEAIKQIPDAAERADQSAAALLGDDVYREFQTDLEGILAEADGLFVRIFALLSRLSRRLTIAEMRRFVDHLIEELEKDEKIRAREPHLIPRLINYRNSLKEETPQLLNQIHARLAEIRRQYPANPRQALRDQLQFLQDCLTDALFRAIWPTIFTIYQNLLTQQFDAHVFHAIAAQLPLERQHQMLLALREGFGEGSVARAAIDRKLRGTELAGIGERILREQTEGAVEELPEILARLESNHHFDPVERVRQEIRDFDAGLPTVDATSAHSDHEEPAARAQPNQHVERAIGWSAERMRKLQATQPMQALEFAGQVLGASEVDQQEKEILCDLLEELSPEHPAVAGLYIFHRTVESAEQPREQLATIRKFQGILPDAIVRGRENSLRLSVARAKIPGRLLGALKEPQGARRTERLREVLKHPQLPEGVRKVVRARSETPADAAFETAFDSICFSPHATASKIQLLQTLGALARSRGWLTTARAKKLEDRIRMYQRIGQTNQRSFARRAPERRYFARDLTRVIQLLRAGHSLAEILQMRDQNLAGGATPPRPIAANQIKEPRSANPSVSSNITAADPIGLPTAGSTQLDEDFMNTPIELEHTLAATGGRKTKKTAGARNERTATQTGRATTSASAHEPPRSGSSIATPAPTKRNVDSAPGGLFGKLLGRVTGKNNSDGESAESKQETISIARLTTRAEKLFLKGDRRDPQQLMQILHTPEDLLEKLKAMPEMKKKPQNKRDRAAEAIKAALTVTVVIPKNNRVLGLPGELCFPRKDWNNEIKRKNLVQSLNALAEKQLPGSEKYNYYKFLSEEIQFHYYQGKYKHGRL